MGFVIPLRQSSADRRLEAANRVIADQLSALATAHAALLHAQEAIAWHVADAFENEDGKPLSEAISEALAAIVGEAPNYEQTVGRVAVIMMEG